MCAQVFMRIKTVPTRFSLASQNWAADVNSLAKATDISNSYRVQLHATKSSITRGNLAGSHAGWAPNSSVNTTRHFTTKGDWLKLEASAHLFIPWYQKESLVSIHRLYTVYHSESVRVIKSGRAHKKLNGWFLRAAEWSSWCLKLVDDGEHVGPPGVSLTLNLGISRRRRKNN